MALPKQCPLCQSDAEKQLVLTNHVYGDLHRKHAFFECASCSVIYLFPQLTKSQEQQFYAQEFEGFMNSRSGESAGWEEPERHIKSNQSQFERRWGYLQNILPKKGKILEFGCSSGFMLYPLQSKDYECFGIEPSGVFSKYVHSRGVEIFEDTTALDADFDVVMHYFVLEHIKEPALFLEENLRLLKPGATLIVEIPNAADPLYTIYNIPAFERFYWSIAHHWYFTKKSFEYLLNNINGISFEIMLDQRYDLSNHMVWARDGKPGGMARFSEKLGSEIEIKYRKALIDSGYADTLIGIIKKL